MSTAKKSHPNNDPDLAAEVIRRKIHGLYGHEPSARMESQEVSHINHPSKHQRYMQQLNTSGKSMADIQTEWHQYYTNLPDDEKHQVWQEFYDNRSKAEPATKKTTSAKPGSGTKTVSQVKKQLLHQVSGRGKLKTKHHVQSILFGLGMGSIVAIIFLFSFFNERIIAPFITPSRAVSDTPIIADSSTTANGPPQVIIPKINVEIPVVYDQPSIEENAIQSSLENGVVHYATTASPGQTGNTVIFGHSSNNILNKGKYKFAFVLLNRLEIGDTFMLTKDGKRYTYRVYKKEVVKPTDVQVLGAAEKPSSATLITCDPPGTSINRLVVVGEQISPDPEQNTASTATASTGQQPAIVPGNAPSLWQNIKRWFTG